MHTQYARWFSRRRFLGGLTLAGTAGLVSLHARRVAAEPPPETTRIRLAQVVGICVAPQYVAEDLLRGEGFTEVHYVKIVANPYKAFADEEIDISMAFVAPFIVQVDMGLPLVLLGGIHVGCFELFGTNEVRAIRDLRGKTVAVPELGGAHHAFLSSMVVYVGLNPHKDIHWVTHAPAESAQLLAAGQVDALVGFPPVP
jgi:NitT/TauT family transport system substrate-binding protein